MVPGTDKHACATEMLNHLVQGTQYLLSFTWYPGTSYEQCTRYRQACVCYCRRQLELLRKQRVQATCCLSLSFPPLSLLSSHTTRPLGKTAAQPVAPREVLEKPADNSLLSCVTACRPMLTPPPALGTGSGLGGRGAIGGERCILPPKSRLPL